MALEHGRETYDGVAKTLHWLILALLIAQFTVAWTMGDITKTSQPVGLIAWHLSIGATILFVMLVRLIWRATHPAPPPPRDLPRALRMLSRITHYLLYAILIVLPLMGWANASARGFPVRLFGAIPLPALLPKGSAFGHTLGDIHAETALILLGVIALHVAGSLYHAVVLRDRTVQRMLPG